MGPGPDDEGGLGEHARLVAIAASMRDIFGSDAGAVVQRQVELADPARPEIARRWRAIAMILARGQP